MSCIGTKSGNLCEIGFGDPTDALFFAQNGFNYVGTDISPTAIMCARAKAPQLKFVQCDTRTIGSQLSPNTFDAIYAHLSLHYFTQKETAKIFKDIFDLLNDGAWFAFAWRSTRDPECQTAMREGEKCEGTPNTYKFGGLTRHYFTEQDIQQLLSGLFSIEYCEELEGNPYGKPAVFFQVIARKIPADIMTTKVASK